ncbi:N-acetyltransferase [Phreatobacter aquaticus]|uniref:N-acetyltransferase n=1 Tax=Phreatobacter aquaticus TaxID=2570229 RepID=A0A4D7QGG4_9HYPH|nr:N-acetyltransferase [Phreatobacter aquaticus]QCK84733.1 N-acetyltransferase [Phreatobacter aquaticus]
MSLHVSDFTPAAIVVADEQARHVSARDALLDQAFGPDRSAKTSERLREDRLPAEGLALVALSAERLVGTVRLWNVTLGAGRPALLLGPIAVDGQIRSAGIGAVLMREALARAADLGHRAVILVGDEAYYRRFGFSAQGMDRLWMPGPLDRARFLGLELAPGALAGAHGLVGATGRAAVRWPDVEIFGRGERGDVRMAA